MALDDLSKLQGSFGYRLCALYLPQRDKSGAMSEALRMLVAGLGEEWRDKATFDDVCMELELAGVGYAGTMRSVVLAGLGESIEGEYTDASEAAGWIAEQDRRLVVWAACACAREALWYVPAGENSPRTAIETAEAWVRGEATAEQVREARRAAEVWSATAYDTSDDDAYDDPAIYAAYAACHAAEATYASPYAADAAAYDAANATATAYGAYAPELRRLVSVIARSLQTFPVLLTAPG